MECLINKSNNMDYLKIVLDGYCNENDRNHLVEYFKREALKAQKDNYSIEVFFDGCKKALSQLQQYYVNQLHKHKSEH